MTPKKTQGFSPEFKMGRYSSMEQRKLLLQWRLNGVDGDIVRRFEMWKEDNQKERLIAKSRNSSKSQENSSRIEGQIVGQPFRQ